MLETTPVGRAPPDARVPGFAAEPKPSPRRAMLDRRRTFATGFRDAGNNPRGSGSARRPRFWIHCCAQAIAASSEARPTKDLRHWIPRCWKQPPWVGLRPTPAFPDSLLSPSHRRVERCSIHEGPSPLDSAMLETTPVGRAPPDARVPGFAAEPKPSPRRAKLDPRKKSLLDSLALETTPVGRAPPDARVPGFAAEPKPSPRRAMLDPRRASQRFHARRDAPSAVTAIDDRHRRNDNAFSTTLTLLAAIAAPAITGSSMPNAASGIPTTL